MKKNTLDVLIVLSMVKKSKLAEWYVATAVTNSTDMVNSRLGKDIIVDAERVVYFI